MRVHVNATGDTLVMKFLHKNENVKLEGFILGYGSNFFSNQYIQWPENGKSYVTEVDAEPRYLIAVKPNENQKKPCKEKNSVQKPLQLVVGTLTPTSVFLSWGILINPQFDWSVLNKCPNNRFYTVRYREKNKDWLYQLCPTTEIVIDNLKPNTMYEFGVKDNSEDGMWSKCQNHKTISKGKENGQSQNTYNIPKGFIQMAPEDTKVNIPITVIKQGFQNISHLISPKSTSTPHVTEKSPVYKEEPKKFPVTTTKSPVTKPKPVKVSFFQMAPEDTKVNIPITVIKQGFQNISHLISPKSTSTPHVTEKSPVYKEEPKKFPVTTTKSPVTKPKPVSKGTKPPSTAKTFKIPDTEDPKPVMAFSAEIYPGSTDVPPMTIHDQQMITIGISTVSTDASQLSPHITLDKQKTTSGLALVPPTPSSAPDITVKRISLPGEQTSSTQATTMQTIQDKYSTLQSQTFTKPTTVTKETISLHSKPIHSTEAPPMEVDNTPVSEIITQEEPHTSEQHKIPIVSSEEQIVQNFATTSIPETETTTVLKGTQPLFLVEEARTTLVPNETQKISPSAPKTTFATESSFPKLDPKTTRHVPINLIRFHISEDPKLPLVPDIREKNVTSKPRKTTESPPSIPVTMTAKQMPINVIRLHVFDDQAVTSVPDATEKIISPKPRKATESPSSTAVPTTAKRIPINFDRFHIFDKPTITRAPSETHTTSRPTPKTSQSNKTSRSKPAPKPTQRVPINVISLQIFEEPEVSLVPNTTHTPPQPKPTQRTKRPITKPVPIETQKASTHKTKKPLPTPRPRAKLASTGSPKEFINPKIPPQTPEATLAPYKLQLSSSRPRTSLRPRTRPAQNGTTQGSIRARPTGDVNWITGTIPGGRAYDSTKLLGVSRNISMEPNNTSRRTFSGSVLLPRAPSTARPNRTTVSVKMPKKQPTTPTPEEDTEETTVFSPGPKSEIDALGKTRYTAPHVKYMRKEDTKPCSITDSLLHFPTEEASNQEILNAPQNPPSNLTVVTVEGCPSFVILDWEQPDNDTVTEYEVISKENGGPAGERESIIITNQTHSTVENLRPDTSYEFKVKPKNPLGEGPISTTVEFNTESADPKVSEPVAAGKDAIWTQIKFKSDSYSECKGKQFVKRTWYKKFVGIQLCNSLRYKIYLSDSLSGTFYNIGDQSGYGEDHCQFVDSFLDGRTGQQLLPEQLTTRKGFYRAVRQQPVEFGDIGGQTQIKYVHWYECGISIPGKW
ncbi:target of Nesh-SH3 [Rhinophrynus dorsalis]